eukprot:1686263-Rhodomonas_salina.2
MAACYPGMKHDFLRLSRVPGYGYKIKSLCVVNGVSADASARYARPGIHSTCAEALHPRSSCVVKCMPSHNTCSDAV